MNHQLDAYWQPSGTRNSKTHKKKTQKQSYECFAGPVLHCADRKQKVGNCGKAKSEMQA
jgi:hypothetical protein